MLDIILIVRGFAFSQEPGQAPQITERLTMRIVRKSSTFNLLDELNEKQKNSLKRKQTHNEISRKSKNANRITSGFGESTAPQLTTQNNGRASQVQITNSINFDFD